MPSGLLLPIVRLHVFPFSIKPSDPSATLLDLTVDLPAEPRLPLLPHEEFDAKLKENGTEMPNYFFRTLLTIIHAIVPPNPTPSPCLREASRPASPSAFSSSTSPGPKNPLRSPHYLLHLQQGRLHHHPQRPGLYRSRGVTFILFVSHHDTATAAVQTMDRKVLNSRTLSVSIAADNILPPSSGASSATVVGRRWRRPPHHWPNLSLSSSVASSPIRTPSPSLPSPPS